MRRSREMDNEATRFVQDVDRILAGHAPQESTDTAYQADIDLASLLSRAHFPPDPGFEARLRNRLRQTTRSKEVPLMTMLQSWLRSAMGKAALGGAIVGVLLAVSLAVSPEARAAAGSLMARFVPVKSPGELLPAPKQPPVPAGSDGSVAQPAPAVGQAQPGPLQPGQPVGSELKPPQNPSSPNIQPTRDLVALEKAQAGVSFTIKLPAKLPEGARLLGAAPMPELPANAPKLPADAPKLPADAPKVNPPESVILIFGNDNGGLFTFTQWPVPNPAGVDVQLPVQGSAQSITINGQVGQYVEFGNQASAQNQSSPLRQVHWQTDDGFMYDLTSTVLSREQLISIAESIK